MGHSNCCKILFMLHTYLLLYPSLTQAQPCYPPKGVTFSNQGSCRPSHLPLDPNTASSLKLRTDLPFDRFVTALASTTMGMSSSATTESLILDVSWNFRGKKFSDPKELKVWAALRLKYRVATETAKVVKDEDIENLRKVMINCGMKVRPANPRRGYPVVLEQPSSIHIPNGSQDDPVTRAKLVRAHNFTQIDEAMRKASKLGTETLFVILPDGDSETYDEIKFLGDVVHGKRLEWCESRLTNTIRYPHNLLP